MAPTQELEVQSELVPYLVNFLKEYHMLKREDAARAMLQDISAEGCNPRPLGPWGKITMRTLREAIGRFEVWKQDGCIGLPVFYYSENFNCHIPCIIGTQLANGRCHLLRDSQTLTTEYVKRDADPNKVSIRPEAGWFLPRVSDQATAMEQPSTTPAPVQQPQRRLWQLQYAFDGESYRESYAQQTNSDGDHYLTLDEGDLVEQQRIDEEWSFGSVVQRADPNRPLPAEPGWYPTNYAVQLPTESSHHLVA